MLNVWFLTVLLGTNNAPTTATYTFSSEENCTSAKRVVQNNTGSKYLIGYCVKGQVS